MPQLGQPVNGDAQAVDLRGRGAVAGRAGHKHGGQCMPSATLFAGVGDLGEVAEQVTALLGRSAAGTSSRWAPAGMGMMEGQACDTKVRAESGRVDRRAGWCR